MFFMKIWLFLLITSILWGACSNSSSSSNDIVPDVEPEPEIMEGMQVIKGGDLVLGSNESSFRAAERPAMKVHLDYEFYLDVHEVTCGSYRILAKKGKVKDFGECANDELPLANVTYFDAVLYANAKSVELNHDTAYTYSKATYDSEGHCTNLEGLAFHPDADAFRLPTEAEWVLAASQSWNPKEKSWNSENSEFHAHPVCTAGKDSLGFCDLAGNVKEWVNDWAGTFRDTTVTNYVGAPDGGAVGERVLKGGYYSDRASEINLVSRGDDYTVESSSHAERIGFRLAFGKIPSPTWLDDNGKVQQSVVSPLASATALKSYTGTYEMILAFRNDISGNLAYINYNDGTLSVTEIEDTLEVYHPDISPDGKHVAFCTRFEGIAGESRLYVRDLNANGSNLVKLDVPSAAIPRWRVVNGDTVIVYVTDAGNNKDETAFAATSTWQVKFANGKFGVPEKLFDGAYHGGISEDNKLAVTGARVLRALLADPASNITQKSNTAIWYNNEQACNASLAQDGSKRTAFLDFAGETGTAFVGTPYATHERIFIADSNGKLLQSVKSPDGYTFDHSEWATDGDRSNIVATLVNLNGAHTKIVLANPTDNSILELAEGDELWHPNLWVKKVIKNDSVPKDTFQLNPDSAGIYFVPGTSEIAVKWRYKIDLLWHQYDSLNTVILGSSRALHGVIPSLFDQKFKALNMANSNSMLYCANFIFENYVLPHVSHLKYIVISIDMDIWFNTAPNSFLLNNHRNYPGFAYDEDHNYWKDAIPSKLAEYTRKSPGYSKFEPLLNTMGYEQLEAAGWGEPKVWTDSLWLNRFPNLYYDNFNLLKTMIEECEAREIYVIGVIFPQNPAYKNTGALGFHGIQRSKAPALIKELADLHDEHPNFVLMDENKMGEHDYTDDMAFDCNHLAHEGAIQMTKRLDSLLQTLP